MNSNQNTEIINRFIKADLSSDYGKMKFYEFLKTLNGKKLLIHVTNYSRVDKYRRFYFKMIVDSFSTWTGSNPKEIHKILFHIGSTIYPHPERGLSKQQVHKILKNLAPSYSDTDEISTRNFNYEDWKIYLERCISFLATEFNFIIDTTDIEEDE